MSKIEKLLIEMLKIISVSGQEKEMGDFLVSRLEGFEIERQSVDKGRFNVIAKKGKPKVYIVVHMDTVPGVVPIKITKDKIFGRGAIDNKGNIAGAILAAQKLENIGLIFTVGEEAYFEGAKKVRIRQGRFIVMEPTRLAVMRGQRGLILATISTRGIQRHSSLDFQREDSAVYNLIDVLHGLYRKKWTAFNAIITAAGEADNVVANFAEAKISIRPENSKEYDKALACLIGLGDKKVSIKIQDKVSPCLSSLVKKGGIAPFFSEMAFFPNSVLFGAGDISLAHSVSEYVDRRELNMLEEKLLQLVSQLEKN